VELGLVVGSHETSALLAQITRLSTENWDLRQQNDKLRRDLAVSVGHHNELKAEIEGYRGVVADLKQQHGQDVSALQLQIEALKADNETLRKSIAEHQAKHAAETKELFSTIAELKSFNFDRKLGNAVSDLGASFCVCNFPYVVAFLQCASSALGLC
jgi:regulator of replication initiation timing